MSAMIQTILDIARRERDAIIAGKYARLNEDPFAGFALNTSPNGSTVIALKLTPEAREALPGDQRHVDLFVLGARKQLGRHYHHHASAQVYFLAGHGIAEIDGVETRIGPGAQLVFPALSVHDVRSGEETVLFASFQDNPILKPDGSVDYHAAPS
jgi:mannose-6-phosphate isomerase-like protein (cupin superfamily)